MSDTPEVQEEETTTATQEPAVNEPTEQAEPTPVAAQPENLPVNNPDSVMNSQELRETPSAPAVGDPAKEATKLEVSVPESLTREPEKKEKGKKAKSPVDTMGAISVRPYVEGNYENMGLETYGFVIFEGTAHEEQLAALERNGVVRYITGLDEFAPEVKNIKDDKQRNAVIHNIRTIVAELEQELATNVIKVDDEEFWNKVTLLKPDNIDFWSKVSLRVSNEPLFLNPKKDPHDLIKLMAIEAGGFDLVAKSYEDAQARPRPPKFYLDKEVNTVATRTEYKKLRNKATGLLDDLYHKNPKKLLYVTKVVDADSAKYKNSTPLDILYDNMDEYIQGRGVEINKTRAAEYFIKSVGLDMETLKLKSIVKDAAFYRFITTKGDGMIYHTEKHAMLGRNVSDVVEFLRNPINEDMLVVLLEQVEEYWNQ